MRSHNDITICSVHNQLLELEVDKSLSRYLVENYDKLRKECTKWVEHQYAEDLLQDCYIAFVENESNGKGFEYRYNENIGGYITVGQAVYGYIKKTAKNEKYHRAGEGGGCEIPSTVLGDNVEEWTFNEREYATFATYDDTDYAERLADLQENLLYIVQADMGNEERFSLLRTLGNVVNTLRDGKGIEDSIKAFEALKPLEYACDELKDAFKSVVGIAVRDIEVFKKAVLNVTSDFEGYAMA